MRLKIYQFSNRKINFFVLSSILIIALVLRLYNINSTIANLNSQEQAESLIVANSIRENGKITGRYEESELEKKIVKTIPPNYNPNRLLVYEYKTAFLKKILPSLSYDQIARVISVISSLIIIICIYFIAYRHQNRLTAIGASLFVALSPISLLLSRMTTNYGLSLATIMMGIVLLYIWSISKNKKQRIILILTSLIFVAVGFATQPTNIVFILPIFYLLFKKFNIDIVRSTTPYLYVFFALLPTTIINLVGKSLPLLLPLPIWANLPEYIKTNEEIFLLRKEFIIPFFQDRIFNGFLSIMGLVLMVIGLFKKDSKIRLFHFFALSAILSLVIFPSEHLVIISMQWALIPAIAFYIGTGIGFLLTSRRVFAVSFFSFLIIGFLTLFSLYLSWQKMKPYFLTNNKENQIAKIISTLTSPDSLVATDTKGDPLLLYLSERNGVATTDNGDTELRMNNIDYLFTANKNYAMTLGKRYQAIFISEGIYIFNLNQQL